MALMAQYVNGVLQNGSTTSSSATGSTSKSDKSSDTAGGALDKDAFLQLLVAQMKYQDPLEPTSNTEYISQLATFSELEEMQNMSGSMDLQRASGLVGKQVIMLTTTTSGAEQYVKGKVDYVAMENGKASLAINGSLYSIDELDTVCDETYLEAYEMAQGLLEKLGELPTAANLTLDYADEVAEIQKTYSGMNDYQKKFITSDEQKVIQGYVDKVAELKLAKEQSGEKKV